MFVTGCHRSGTSLLASLMHGLVTGQDPRQRCGDLALQLENPLGFFESERLVMLNDGLLDALGCQWDRPPLLPVRWDCSPLFDSLQDQRSRIASYALESAWVDKDPRLCITYPAYLHILLRRIPLLVALREPLSVAISLHARNGFSFNSGLVLWWIYNYHIASQLCSTDLLVPYSALLMMDEHGLQKLFGPFLEFHNHQRPSIDLAQDLIASFLKPEYNRSSGPLNSGDRARLNPNLLNICQSAHEAIIQSSDKLASFQEHFSSLPRPVLECSVQNQLSPETQASLLKNRLYLKESEMRNISSSLEKRNQDCLLLEAKLRDLKNSRSWKITAPLRSLGDFFRSTPD